MTDVYLVAGEPVDSDVVLREFGPVVPGRLNHFLRIAGPNGATLRYGNSRVFDRGGSSGCTHAGGNAHGIFLQTGTGFTWRLAHFQDANGNNPNQKFAGGRLVSIQAIRLRAGS